MNKESRANIIVTASAGTGKTYRLVSEFVNTVLGTESNETPVHPRAILALTFTEKAAAEMKTRISSRFADLELPNNTMVKKYVRDLEQATITTYHSFCAKILRDYAQQVGVDKRFKLLDTFEENQLAQSVAKSIVLRKLDCASEALLSLVARFRLEGRGDTNGVVGYLVRIREELVESGISPEFLPRSPHLPFAELLNSSALKEAMDDCESAFNAYNSSVLSLSDGARKKVTDGKIAFERLNEVLKAKAIDSMEIRISSLFSVLRETISGRFGPDELRKNLVATISALGSLLCASCVVLEEEAFRELLIEFWTELEKTKKAAMRLSFGDLLVLTRRLLRENLSVRSEVKVRYKRVLVDEYQDTSPIQEDIVALICEDDQENRTLDPKEPALGALSLTHGKLFVVGDPKQSIYGFRGSDVTLFHKMVHEIQVNAGLKESLNISRRSAPAVIDVVNQVIQCDPMEQLVAMRDGSDVAGAILKSGSEPQAIASEVVALLTAQSDIAKKRLFEPKDIAILVRRVKKAGAILQALTEAGVPARVYGGEGFFDRQEVIELSSALILVCDPNDSVALLTVMRSPLLEFPDSLWPVLFEELQTSNSKWTWSSVMHGISQVCNDNETKEKFAQFNGVLQQILEKIHFISADEALDKLLMNGSYFEAIQSEADANLCLANIQKLKSLLRQDESDFVGQVAALTRKVRLAPKESMGEEEIEVNAVRIMTIHQSKGLEFPVVFVADTLGAIPSESSDILFDPKLGLAISFRGRPIAVCAPDSKGWVLRFPTPIQAVRARLRAKNEAELSRLLYVALTRAKDFIYFTDATLDAEQAKAIDRGCTLRNLFTRGLQTGSDSVRALMPERSTIQARVLSLTTPAPSEIRNMASDTIFPHENPLRKLIYASEMIETPCDTQGLLRSERLFLKRYHSMRTNHAYTSSERGQLAHALIRMATEQLTIDEFENEAIIREVLQAGLRMQGHDLIEELDSLVDACAATLESVIWPMLKAEFIFKFEVPMKYEGEHFVVKGYSDAIASRGDIACIIDFKSSDMAAKSEKTNLQLLAYCAAHSQLFIQRVFYASCVIGERSPLDFEPFDETARMQLDEHLNESVDILNAKGIGKQYG